MDYELARLAGNFLSILLFAYVIGLITRLGYKKFEHQARARLIAAGVFSVMLAIGSYDSKRDLLSEFYLVAGAFAMIFLFVLDRIKIRRQKL